VTSVRGRYAIPALLVLVVVGMALPVAWPLTSIGTNSHDAIDTHLFLWGFWWTRHAVAELQNPYWTDLLLYPSGTSLAFSSFPLPYNLASLVMQYAIPGITGLVVAFNVITLLSFALNGLAAYALSVRLTASRLAGFVAGFVFACIPYRFLNVARLHVLGTEFLVLFVLAWIWYTDAPSHRRAGAVGAAFAATIYTSPEYALFAALFAGLWKIFHWKRWREFFSRRFVTTGATALLVAGVLYGPLLVLQIRALSRGEVTPARSLDETALWSPAVASFVTPSRQQPVYGRLFAFAGEYEDEGVRGMRSETTVPLTVLLLGAVGFLRARRDRAMFWAAACAVFFVLCLGPYLRLTGTTTTAIPLPYLALYHLIWPLRAARDPTRMLPMALLMLSVLAAFGARAWLQRVGSSRAALSVTAIIVALAGFESLMRWPAKTPARDLIPTGYQRLAGVPAPSGVIDLTGDHQAMLAQTTHGLPITAGRYANPRSSAAQKMLYVESDFRDPRQVLTLDADRRMRYVAADRQMLDMHHIRFVVAPAGSAWAATFAGMLGLRMIESGAVVVYERTE